MRRAIAGAFFCFFALSSHIAAASGYIEANISGKVYRFEVARSPQEKATGLMFRKQLDRDSGMLFVFSEPQFLDFYMKDTSIALDVAFLDSNFKIVDIRSMRPFDEKVIISSAKAIYALEVNQSFFSCLGLRVSDHIEFLDQP